MILNCRGAALIFKGKDTKRNVTVAIKKMNIDPKRPHLVVSEIGIMKTTIHPNIVKYYDR
jgi:serine/threonine protein kinase